MPVMADDLRCRSDVYLFLRDRFFFFNDTATTEIYTLSLHDALPISQTLTCQQRRSDRPVPARRAADRGKRQRRGQLDRKSTRLNSSHSQISYAVFCLKKKNTSQCDRRSHSGCECRASYRDQCPVGTP